MITASDTHSHRPEHERDPDVEVQQLVVEHVGEEAAQRHEVAVGEVDVVRDPELQAQTDRRDREHRCSDEPEPDREPEEVHWRPMIGPLSPTVESCVLKPY